jgi:hypothetical protein
MKRQKIDHDKTSKRLVQAIASELKRQGVAGSERKLLAIAHDVYFEALTRGVDTRTIPHGVSFEEAWSDVLMTLAKQKVEAILKTISSLEQ